ncbi:ribonuclease H-like domain-containing protein [Tanacetum coccineum]
MDTNIVYCIWLFRHKYHAYGTLSRYKARLVANGNTQLEGIDVDETFSPVVKPNTIRTVVSLATSRYWLIHQLDVKNAFLYSDLSKTVYMHQPLGFRDYGMDTSYLLLYVDDIVLTASSKALLQQIISSLHQEFSITDLDSLNYFLGIFVTRDSSWMFLSQRKYATRSLSGLESLCELHTPLSSAMLVYCDNVNAVYLSSNPVQHQRTMHIEIDIHFVQDLVAAALFEEFHTSLSVRSPPAPTAGKF